MFLLYIVGTSFCETMGYSWFWKINFLTRALPYFVMGYWIRLNFSREGTRIQAITRHPELLALVGCIITILPVILKTRIQFSSIGLVPYSFGIFLIGVQKPERCPNKNIAFIGDKLSLSVYIFHPIIGSVLSAVGKRLPIVSEVLAWGNSHPLDSSFVSYQYPENSSFIKSKERSVVTIRLG